MTFPDFQHLVSNLLDEIPPEAMTGLQGVHVFEHVKRDPDEPELVRMGEYLDPGPDSVFNTYTHLGRHVAIYYGSFQAVAGGNLAFDWEAEAWETLTHEIQHHVESRAGERGLIEWDIERLEAYRKQKRAEKERGSFWRWSA